MYFNNHNRNQSQNQLQYYQHLASACRVLCLSCWSLCRVGTGLAVLHRCSKDVDIDLDGPNEIVIGRKDTPVCRFRQEDCVVS